MNSIRDIISSLNEGICEILPKGSEVNGLAELVPRDEITLPEIDGKFVGIDDKYPVRIYHRLNSVSSSIKRNTGVGRSTGDQVNVYGISMVIFLQQQIAKLYPDELMLFFQAHFPEQVKLNPYKLIIISFNSSAMDSQSVWKQEYTGGTEYKLKSNQFLFKINYSIETTFSKGCFKECP